MSQLCGTPVLAFSFVYCRAIQGFVPLYFLYSCLFSMVLFVC